MTATLLIWALVLLGCSDSSTGTNKRRPQPDDVPVSDNSAALGQRCKHRDYDACREACKHGEQRACVVLGDALMEGRIGRMQDEQGRQLLRNACEHGAGDGCFVLARRLMREPGRDLASARSYFARGCDLEDWASCVRLADMLQFGRGGDADPAAAQRALDRACKGGMDGACAALGASKSERPPPPPKRASPPAPPVPVAPPEPAADDHPDAPPPAKKH